MFMLFLMSMISRLFAVRLCSSVVSLFTVGHVRRFIYYLGELMGLIACPYPSIFYEAMFVFVEAKFYKFFWFLIGIVM